MMGATPLLVIFDEGQDTEKIVIYDDSFEETMNHIWCNICYPEDGPVCLALCGTDLSDDEDSDEEWRLDDIECIVCRDLDDTHPCPRKKT